MILGTVIPQEAVNVFNIIPGWSASIVEQPENLIDVEKSGTTDTTRMEALAEAQDIRDAIEDCWRAGIGRGMDIADPQQLETTV